MGCDGDEFRGRENLYAEGGIQAIRPFCDGHVMTARDLNEIVEALKELDRRLSAIEQR